MNADYTALARWIQDQSDRTPFGEIVIKIVKHDNQVRQVEKTVTTRERPTTAGNVEHALRGTSSNEAAHE